MKRKIRQALFDLGIPPNLNGFDFWVEGILFVLETERPKMGMVYLYIANKFNTKDSRVERAMRYAITRINKNGDAWKRYVGIDINKNSEIIYTIASKIREECENEEEKQ